MSPNGKAMSGRNLSRRLERLEAQLTPSDERVLTIEATFVGHPEMNRTLELRLPEPTGRGRRQWHGGRDRPLRVEGPGIEH